MNGGRRYTKYQNTFRRKPVGEAFFKIVLDKIENAGHECYRRQR
jgi:hypothetical protein